MPRLSSTRSNLRRQRRLMVETLERRQLMAIDLQISTTPSTIYEGGGGTPTSTGHTRYQHSKVDVALTGFSTVNMVTPNTTVVLRVTGDTDAYTVVDQYDMPVSGGASSPVGVSPAWQDFTIFTGSIANNQAHSIVYVKALDDSDLTNEQLSLHATYQYLYYDANFIQQSAEASGDGSVTIIDNDHKEQMTLSADDSEAREAAPSNGACTAQPIDPGYYKITVPDHWKGGSVDLKVIGPSGTGVADPSDYTLSLEPLPAGVIGDYILTPNVSLPGYTLQIPSRVRGSGSGPFVPQNFSFVRIKVTPVNDGVAEPTETLTLSLVAASPQFTWNENELDFRSTPLTYPYTEDYIVEVMPGNAVVNIGDSVQAPATYTLDASPASEKEYASLPSDMARLVITPTNTAACMSRNVYLRFDAPPEDSTTENNAATPNVDFTLTDSSGTPVIMNLISAGVWQTAVFTIPAGSPAIEFVVVPINDQKLENDELVKASLMGVKETTQTVDPQLDSTTVTIEEMYLRSRQEDMTRTESCSCTCVCSAGGIDPTVTPEDGKASASSSQLPIQAYSTRVNDSTTVMLIGIPLYADKAVPTSISVQIDVMYDDPQSRQNGSKIGAKSVGLVLSFTINVPTTGPDAVSPGDTIWLPAVLDFGAIGAPPETYNNTNTAVDQVLNLRLLAHPTFATPTPSLNQLFSGWLGYHSTVVSSATAGIFATPLPDSGAGEAPGLFSKVPTIGPPGTTLMGTSRAILNAKMLVSQDTSTLPYIDDYINGQYVRRVGDAVRYRGLTNAVLAKAYITDDGEAQIYADGPTSPFTLNNFSGSTLTDRYMNQTTFDSAGRITSRIDALGNVSSFAYSPTSTTVTDAAGNILRIDKVSETLTYNGNGSVVNYKGTYVTDRSNPLAATNRSVDVQWTQTVTSVWGNSGTLVIRGQDPDGTGPRRALEERLIFTGGSLSRIERVEVGGGLLQSVDMAYSTALGATANLPGRSVGTLTRQDGAVRSFESPQILSRSYVIPNGSTIYSSSTTVGGATGLPAGSNIWSKSIDALSSPFAVSLASSTDWNGNRTIYKVDDRGRLIQRWDPIQVESVVRDLIPTSLNQAGRTTWLRSMSLTDPTIRARFTGTTYDNLSYQYWRIAAERSTWGDVVTGKDLGEVLAFVGPDADDYTLREFPAVQRTNGSLETPYTIYGYTTDKNQNSVTGPNLPATSTTYNSTFDVPTSYTDETGAVVTQTVNPANGLVTRRVVTTVPSNSLRYNRTNPLDVNNSGSVSAIDQLQVITALNSTTPPDFSTAAAPYFDTDGNGYLSIADSEQIVNFLSGKIPAPNVLPLTTVSEQIDYTYVSLVGLPKGLVETETVTTGRSSGSITTKYSYYYDASKAYHAKLYQVTQAFGTSAAMTTTYQYDTRGRLQAVIDPAGRTTTYAYDLIDRLTAVIGPDPDGAGALLSPVQRFDYDTLGRIIATETINSSYDTAIPGSTRVLTTALVDGYQYNDFTNQTSQYRQASTNTWYLYAEIPAGGSTLQIQRTNVKANLVGKTVASMAVINTMINANEPILNSPVPGTPNSLGIATKYPGLVTTWNYDYNGNLLSTSEVDSAVPANNRISKMEYDRLDRPVAVISPNPGFGVFTTIGDVRDANGGFITRFTYDNVGNVRSVVDPLGQTTQMEYDILGRVIKVTDAAGGQSTWNYIIDASGWTVKSTNAAGQSVTARTDFRGNPLYVLGDTVGQIMEYWTDGQLKSVMDELGNKTNYEYDAVGRVSKVIQPAGNLGNALRPTTSLSYTTDGLLSSSLDPEGRLTRYEYDAGGRRIRTIAPPTAGPASVSSAISYVQYDSLGNVIYTGDGFSDPSINAFKAENQLVRYVRDARFQATEQYDELGRKDTMVYDNFGRLKSITDSNSNLTSYAYNQLDQPVTETQWIGVGATAVPLNRSRTYDGNGNVRQFTDRNNRLTQWGYDALNRVQSENWYLPFSNTLVKSIGFTYDAIGNVRTVDDSDAVWGTDFQFAYDKRNQLQLERQVIGNVPNSVVLDRDYDARGNVTRLAANIGGTINTSVLTGGINDLVNAYTYDGMSRLTSVTQSANGGHNVNSKQATFAYNLASQLTKVVRSTSIYTPSLADTVVDSRFSYDAAGRLTGVLHAMPGAATTTAWDGSAVTPTGLNPAKVLAAYSIGYDRDNRVTEFSSLSDRTKTTYAYDGTDQVTSANTENLAGTQVIPIQNPSFEFPNVGADGAYNYYTVTGWVTAGTMGAYNPGPGIFTNRQSTDGQQVVYVQTNANLKQTLTTNLAPSTQYVLSVDVGDDLTTGMPDYALGLYSGGVLLAQVTKADFGGLSGAFVTASVVYNSPATVSALPLEIRLSSTSTQMYFDNVRLTATPFAVPIQNASFEAPSVGGDGAYNYYNITGWTTTGVAGAYNPTPTNFIGKEASDGQQVAYALAGTVSQVLTTTLQPNYQYTLLVDVGDAQGITFSNYSVGLYAGGTLLSKVGNAEFAGADGRYTTVSAQYTSPASVTSQPIEIRLTSDGTEAFFDNVRLIAKPLNNIPIVNPSFEATVVGGDGASSALAVPGWIKLGSSGVINPTSSHYSAVQATDGQQVAYFNSGTFTQILTTAMAANTRYRLSVDVGDRLTTALSNYKIRLYAGSTLLGTIDKTMFPGVNGGWQTAVLEYVSGNSVAPNQLFQIQLNSDGAGVDFDNVRLTGTKVETVPVTNSSFELPSVGGDGAYNYYNITGWTTTGTTGLFNPAVGTFTFQETTEGQQNAYLMSATVSQVLTTSLAPNKRYQLYVDVGDALTTALSNYTIGLYAGGVLLKQIGKADFPIVDGQWRTVLLEYSTSTTVTGGALEIRFASDGAEVYFDNVRFVIAGPESYAYDNEGNRLATNGASQSAAGMHNRLASDGTYSYYYDAEGNVISRVQISTGAVTNYTWDHRNRLIEVQNRVSASGAITQLVKYGYDAFDRRTLKTLDADGNGTVDKSWAYVHDGEDELLVLRDSDGAGAAQTYRIADRFLHAAVTDMVLADEQYAEGVGPLMNATAPSTAGSQTLWTLGDHLGSIRDVVDNKGIVRQHVTYDSYGRRTSEVDRDASNTVIASNSAAAIDELFGYTGRDWDSDTKLQYNRARWYDPATGRWMSQDPIGFAAGDANLYRYVGNQATGVTDPSGLIPPIIIAGGLVAAWYFFTPEVAAAPSPSEVKLLPGIIRANQEQNIRTSVSLLTVPVGGGAAGLATTCGKTAMARIAFGGLAGGTVQKLSTDGINEVLFPGHGVSTYIADPVGTAGAYGVNVLFWSGGMAIGEGYELLRPRFGNPQIVNLGGEFEPLSPHVDPSKVIIQQGPWVRNPQVMTSGNYPGSPPSGLPLLETLINNGRRVAISPNESLPFATSSTMRVYTNGCPIDIRAFQGAGIQSSEVYRILIRSSGSNFGGQWYNNGYPQIIHIKLPIVPPKSNE